MTFNIKFQHNTLAHPDNYPQVNPPYSQLIWIEEHNLGPIYASFSPVPCMPYLRAPLRSTSAGGLILTSAYNPPYILFQAVACSHLETLWASATRDYSMTVAWALPSYIITRLFWIDRRELIHTLVFQCNFRWDFLSFGECTRLHWWSFGCVMVAGGWV